MRSLFVLMDQFRSRLYICSASACRWGLGSGFDKARKRAIGYAADMNVPCWSGEAHWAKLEQLTIPNCRQHHGQPAGVNRELADSLDSRSYVLAEYTAEGRTPELSMDACLKLTENPGGNNGMGTVEVPVVNARAPDAPNVRTDDGANASASQRPDPPSALRGDGVGSGPSSNGPSRPNRLTKNQGFRWGEEERDTASVARCGVAPSDFNPSTGQFHPESVPVGRRAPIVKDPPVPLPAYHLSQAPLYDAKTGIELGLMSTESLLKVRLVKKCFNDKDRVSTMTRMARRRRTSASTAGRKG
eukprot:16445958-Heterocapsa_arctica.AAC.1